MESFFTPSATITDWDTTDDERLFLGYAYLLLEGTGYRDHDELAQLLALDVDETWFADRYRAALYSGIVAALLAAKDKAIIRGRFIWEHAENQIGEQGWAAKEISLCVESVAEADTEHIKTNVLPLWFQKAKRPQMVTVLAKIDEHLSLPPTTKRMAEIDKRVTEALDIWREKPDFATPKENVFDEVMREIWEPFPDNTYLKTGLPTLDQYLGGGICGKGSADAGKLIVIAARPGVGKTLVAMNIAMHVAMADLKVAAWSLEMGDKQVAQRVLCSLALHRSGWRPGMPFHSGKHPNYHMLRTRNFDHLDDGVAEEFRQLSLSREYQQVKNNIHVFSKCGSATPEAIVGQMAMFAQTHRDTGLFIIDHLQLLNVDGRNQAIALGEATRQMKDIARRLGIDVILVSQLNRGVEMREDKTPEASDLRGSGRIEEDADVILGLARASGEDDKERMRLTVLKNRQGGLGDFPLLAKLSCCSVMEDALL